MAKRHIRTIKTRGKTEILLVVNEQTTLSRRLASRLSSLGCNVKIAKPGNIPFFPYQYCVLLHLHGVPKACSEIVKRGGGKLLFVDKKENKLIKGTLIWLNKMAAHYDVDYLMLRESDGTERIISTLFGYSRSKTKITRKASEVSQKIIKDRQASIQNKGVVLNKIPVSGERKKERLRETPLTYLERRYRLPSLPQAILLAMLIIIITIFIAPPAIAFSRGMVTLMMVTQNKTSQQEMLAKLAASYHNWQEARGGVTATKSYLGPLFRFPPFSYLDHLTSFGLHLSSSASQALALSQLGKELVSSVFGNATRASDIVVNDVSKGLSNLQLNLAATESDLKRALKIPLIGMTSKVTSEYLASLYELNKNINKFREILTLLPRITGSDGEKKYLIILQNNAELRPSGGFIGSFAIVSFEKGRLANMDVYDIYTADGQLKGHVEPPKPIRQYLRQPHWYMRDANFYPDFPESAEQVEWFLEKEMNIKVNGTIALDLTAAEELINSLGGLYLKDYGYKLKGENLFLTTQAESETNFFPGSTGKRDFLGSIVRSLQIELTSNQELPWLEIGQTLLRLLDEKHIMIYFHDQAVQKFFDQADWSGRLYKVECLTKDRSCLADYFLTSEANLGVNKANAFLSRKIRQKIMISSTGVDRQALIEYTNEGGAAFPSGNYKAYIRVYLPIAARELEISISGKRVANQSLDISNYQDKLEIGFPLSVPAKSSRNITVSYKLATVPAGEFIYQLALQKQPGTKSDPLTLVISTDGYNIMQTNFPIELASRAKDDYNVTSSNYATHATDLSVDRIFRLNLKSL